MTNEAFTMINDMPVQGLVRILSAAASGEKRSQIDKPTTLSLSSQIQNDFLSMIFRLTVLHSYIIVAAFLNNCINGLNI